MHVFGLVVKPEGRQWRNERALTGVETTRPSERADVGGWASSAIGRAMTSLPLSPTQHWKHWSVWEAQARRPEYVGVVRRPGNMDCWAQPRLLTRLDVLGEHSETAGVCWISCRLNDTVAHVVRKKEHTIHVDIHLEEIYQHAHGYFNIRHFHVVHLDLKMYLQFNF